MDGKFEKISVDGILEIVVVALINVYSPLYME